MRYFLSLTVLVAVVGVCYGLEMECNAETCLDGHFCCDLGTYYEFHYLLKLKSFETVCSASADYGTVQTCPDEQYCCERGYDGRYSCCSSSYNYTFRFWLILFLILKGILLVFYICFRCYKRNKTVVVYVRSPLQVQNQPNQEPTAVPYNIMKV